MKSAELEKLGLGADVAGLTTSASRWMEPAMSSWAADEHTQVGMLAPLAVEHLCKAVLWRRNPALRGVAARPVT